MGLDIVSTRLRAQRLTAARFQTPEAVVRWMGAVQAQEYADAKWALALRMRRASESSIERAFSDGRILRTHVLRPTWHFVTPADIRWMLSLTGPRVSARMAPYNRALDLDAGVFRRSQRAMASALRGGAQLTRQELKAVLERAGIHTGGVQRLAHIVMQAELDAVICSGARQGTQFTYALLDERVPPMAAVPRASALAELTRRYFVSHGPAQAADFAWWSGLTMADVRAGLEMVKSDLARESVNGRVYWFSPALPAVNRRPVSACLLPVFDEYLIAYKDRSAALDVTRWKAFAGRDGFVGPMIVAGRVVGGWKRTKAQNSVAITLSPIVRVDASAHRDIAESARAFARFLGLKLTLVRRPFVRR